LKLFESSLPAFAQLSSGAASKEPGSVIFFDVQCSTLGVGCLL